MNDYIKIKMVAWTAEIEQLKTERIIAEKNDSPLWLEDISERLAEISEEILRLLGENKKES